ncbi:MAG: response regulator receiver protein [Verrucomicrobiales bacterium]|nr:response regulator receiver protein [Verrucomicrobiales bacterium]
MKHRKQATEAFFYTLIFLLTVAIAWGDELTGFEVRFFVFYYLPIGAAAWRGGKTAGLIVSIVALVGWGYSNFNIEHQSTFVRYWNAGIVLIAFLTVAFPMAWIGREVRQLRQLLPICAWCKNIRDDRGYWQQVEKYLQRRDKTQFTHAVCPDCAERFHKPVVLHAETNSDEIFSFRNAVTKADLPHRLFSVPDGQQAIDWLTGVNQFADRTQFPSPDVLLIDLKMPKKNGFELLEWVRAQKEFKDLPVLILSSSEEPDQIKKAYELGATSYFVKSANYSDVTEFLSTSSHVAH